MKVSIFTSMEKEILQEIKSKKRFPIVRFELRNSEEPDLRSTALNYVYIKNSDDSMELVKERATAIQSLMGKKKIEVCYSLPAYVQSDYDVYYKSKLYEMLCHMVLEAEGKEGFLFNMPAMRFGQIYLK